MCCTGVMSGYYFCNWFGGAWSVILGLSLLKYKINLLQDQDDDATLTQLSLAWFNLAVVSEWKNVFLLYVRPSNLCLQICLFTL